MIISKLFLLFIIYSMVGWLIEVTISIVSVKKFINRGFLIGPYCPIYGVGGILIILLLTKYNESLLVLFTMSIFLCSILEYLTSYLMEKLFNARWWDYSNFKFNINGRICLETMIPFGILACFMVKLINPLIFSLFDLISINILNIMSIIIALLFILDFSISLHIIISFKYKAMIFLNKDNTEEITQKVKEKLFNKSSLITRVVNLFSKFKSMVRTLKDEFSKIKNQINRLKKELKQTRKPKEAKLLKKIRKEVKK